ncbi:phage tail protein [Undibacterium sp. TC9W]|uniref:phage tail protein n=1 Tax=Undibacterium sp. TC9W TaxID=3413053 RepID=UPI003BEF7730
MTDIAQLLPPNASELESNLVRIAPRAVMDTAADAPANLFTSLPASFQPWLAAEWNLSQFSLHFDSTADLIDAGLPWLRERGSAASVLRILAWIGYDNVTIEEDEFYVHIDPGTTLAALDLARIRQVVNASIPAHSRFYRLYHGLDLRAGRFDGTSFDQCLFDDDSGIWSGDPATDGVKLSFGETHTATVNAPPALAPIAAHRPRQLNTIVDDSMMQLDSWVLDSEIRLNSVVSISDLSTGIVNQPALQPLRNAHHATYCAVLNAQQMLAPIKAIAPSTSLSVCKPALPVYGWADQWTSGWAVTYPLIAIPPNPQ